MHFPKLSNKFKFVLKHKSYFIQNDMRVLVILFPVLAESLFELFFTEEVLVDE